MTKNKAVEVNRKAIKKEAPGNTIGLEVFVK
jgi:hypothetical protein